MNQTDNQWLRGKKEEYKSNYNNIISCNCVLMGLFITVLIIHLPMPSIQRLLTYEYLN